MGEGILIMVMREFVKQHKARQASKIVPSGKCVRCEYGRKSDEWGLDSRSALIHDRVYSLGK